MKAIMISIKPIFCAKIMNGDKTIEVRKNKALATAIQKLIDKQGFANIYVYCSKGKERLVNLIDDSFYCGASTRLNGKVVFKFRCYKMEEIVDYGSRYLVNKDYPHTNEVARQSCLDFKDLKNYLKGKNGHAIHISNLEIFDEPKELNEFETTKSYLVDVGQLQPILQNIRLTKAPQNFCYIEVENNE